MPSNLIVTMNKGANDCFADNLYRILEITLNSSDTLNRWHTRHMILVKINGGVDHV